MVDKQDLENGGGLVMLAGIEFYVLGSDDVDSIEIGVVGHDEHTHSAWISLGLLEQFVNAARAYLGQPVLADEMMNLRDAFSMDPDSRGKVHARINEVLHRLGKLKGEQS